MSRTEHIIMNNTHEQETLLSLPLRHHFKGYACIKILIATRLTGFKGCMKYKADVALKRKIVFPLFSTINVCGERERGEREGREGERENISHLTLRSKYTFQQIHKSIDL